MPTSYPSVTPLQAALASACPRCGKGKLYKGFLSLNERCSVCGLDLSKTDSGDGPAVFLIFILGFLAVPLAFWIEVSFDVPMWMPALISGIFVIVLALLMLRPAKAMMVALQYRHRRDDYGPGA